MRALIYMRAVEDVAVEGGGRVDGGRINDL